jgi:hypothetical protein
MGKEVWSPWPHDDYDGDVDGEDEDCRDSAGYAVPIGPDESPGPGFSLGRNDLPAWAPFCRYY